MYEQGGLNEETAINNRRYGFREDENVFLISIFFKCKVFYIYTCN